LGNIKSPLVKEKEKDIKIMAAYSKYKDFFIRQQLKNIQYNKYVWKYLLLNQHKNKINHFKIMLQIQQEINATSMGNKHKNRCMFSSKVRAVSRITNLTKATMKSNLAEGGIVGFKKAS